MTNIDKERAKKIRDHKFYLENFCKVKTKDHGLQPFVLKEAQKDIFNEMKKHNRIIILKARQLGFSTAITGFFYVDTIMRPGVTTALIGYNSDMVAELLDKVKTFYRTTPEPLRPRTQYDSKYQMSFPKMDSKILVLPNTKDVGRGYTIHNCLSGNTDVFTQNGRTKKIKDVNVGDWIVNGNGGLSKVESFAKLENKENLLELDVVGCGKIRMTKDHQVLTREFKTGKEVWKRADELVNNNTHISKYNEYIAYPYFQPRKRFKEAKIENTVDEKYISRSFVSKANIKLDYDLGCLVGWYLAEGTTSYGRVSFSLDKSEVDSFIKLAGKFQGNYISRISTSPSKDSRTVVVYLYSKNFSNFIEQYFGRTEEKCINDSVWYWGPDFLKGLIYGLFRGDGCFNEKNKVILTSTNESIIYQTKKILVSLRIGVPNIYKNKSYRYNKENKDRYDLVLNGAGNYKFRRIFNLDMPSNFKYSRWRTIEEKYKYIQNLKEEDFE
ncbi:MAG: LAGLIDADG family homing endonuclease, partial [archaeon]